MSPLGMWDRLVGQERAVTALRRALADEAIAHAYLFVGPRGVGRELAAFALAAALNCDEGGCGECDACRKILRRAHADVTLIEAEGAQILVDQVRSVRRMAYRSPVEGRTKVFILAEAHKLNPAAANALLKVLEEPPAGVVLILVTASPDDLLPTVVSRCRRIDFAPLGQAAIRTVLTQHHAADVERAAWAARTGGDLSRALRFVKDPDAPMRRESHLEIAGRLVRGGLGASIEIAAELAAEAARARDQLAREQAEEQERLEESFGDARAFAPIRKRLDERHKRELRRIETEVYDSALHDVASFYRDVLLLGAGAPVDVLINTEWTERLDRAASVADPAWLAWALDRIEATRRALGRSAQPSLALEALFMELSTPRARASAAR